jgi:TatD DNase family protein
MFIDTHAHLYSSQFDEDQDAMLLRAADAGVNSVYLPAIDSRTHTAMLALEARHPQQCVAMMGVHPCSIHADYETELAIAKQYLDSRDFCAIGEIGIDLHWDKTTLDSQKIAFRTQINWAKGLDKPIVIHARESLHEILPIIIAEKTDRLRGIFHCFGGSLQQAKQCIDLGFWLGIGGTLTYKNSSLQRILVDIPLEHIVLETDAPYLPPTPYRGKRNESSYIPIIAQFLADVKGCSVAEVAAVTTANAQRIFGVVV